jgi:hypothetical protein
MSYNYEDLETSLQLLTGFTENKINYLNNLHEILLQHFVKLSEYIGRLKGKTMLLETAKGRKDYEISNPEVEDFFAEYYKAEAYLELINRVTSITQQKVKLMVED